LPMAIGCELTALTDDSVCLSPNRAAGIVSERGVRRSRPAFQGRKTTHTYYSVMMFEMWYRNLSAFEGLNGL